MPDFLKIYLPIFVIVIIGFMVTYRFVDPAPPNTITIATGGPNGAYSAFAEQYKTALKKSGITVKIRHTAGARENLSLLTDPKSGVSMAFVQGGIGDPYGAPGLKSLGSLFYEPVWVLTRGQKAPRHLGELKGKRIAIGMKGSGTRVLARTLLSANGVHGDNSTLINVGGGPKHGLCWALAKWMQPFLYLPNCPPDCWPNYAGPTFTS